MPDDIDILTLIALSRKNKNKKIQQLKLLSKSLKVEKKFWVHPIFLKRNELGHHLNLFQELKMYRKCTNTFFIT